jgi:rubrerythrin
MDYTAQVDFWRVDDLFMSVRPDDIILEPQQKQKLRALFLSDMGVESDAKNLYEFLHAHHLVSVELERFLKPWLYEELKHADAFRRILSLTHALDEHELLDSLQQRTYEFNSFGHLLEDEFKLCVLMAYDECSTIMAYRKDSFYQNLGPKEFIQWHKLVIADEARHLRNAVHLIHCKHPQRIKETDKVLEEIINTEQTAPNYHGTFIFDRDEHNENNQPTLEELTTDCVARVRRLINAL